MVGRYTLPTVLTLLHGGCKLPTNSGGFLLFSILAAHEVSELPTNSGGSVGGCDAAGTSTAATQPLLLPTVGNTNNRYENYPHHCIVVTLRGNPISCPFCTQEFLYQRIGPKI